VSLRNDGKVIIEVGLNETADRSRNPHVPYAPDTIIPAGVAAARAGAAVLHFHARRPDGSQDWTGHDIYREAMTGIGGGIDAMCYPSYLGDMSHVWALDDDPPGKGPGLEFAPFDVVQHFRRTMWDHEEQRLRANTALDGNTDRPDTPPELTEIQRRGLIPTVAAFELGELRWAILAARCGMLTSPVNLKVFLTDTWMKGPFADLVGLDAFVSQIPEDLDAEIMLVPYEMTTRERTEALLRGALERGWHVRVGIGDNPGAFPDATNAELVEWAVQLAAEHDLSPATPADIRRRYART
jgi:uncharacterized protein (DUF849 family)